MGTRQSMNREANKGRARRGMIFMAKAMIVLGCTAVVVYQGRACVGRLIAFHISETVEVLPPGQTVFPALTVCPNYFSAYKARLLHSLGLTVYKYRKGAFYPSGPNATGLTPEQTFNLVTFNLTDLVSFAQVFTSTASRNTINIPLDETLIQAQNVGNWSTVYEPTYGKCFSLKLSRNVTKLGIKVATFKTHLNTYIFLHYPGQFKDGSSPTRGYTYRGRRFYVNIQYGISIDSLGAQSNIPCLASLVGHYDECVYKKISDHIVSHFGCTVPWLPTNATSPPVTYCQGTKAKAAVARYQFLSKSNLTRMCPFPCEYMDFTTGWPDESSDLSVSEGFIRFYFGTRVKMKTTVRDYTWLSMVAEIGGYVGLMLGVAVVDVAKIMGNFNK